MGTPQDSSGAGQWRAVSTGAQRGLDAFISGSIPHPGDVSELPAGPPITQESVNLAETICSTSDNVLYVTYPLGEPLGRSSKTTPLPQTTSDHPDGRSSPPTPSLQRHRRRTTDGKHPQRSRPSSSSTPAMATSGPGRRAASRRTAPPMASASTSCPTTSRSTSPPQGRSKSTTCPRPGARSTLQSSSRSEACRSTPSRRPRTTPASTSPASPWRASRGSAGRGSGSGRCPLVQPLLD